MRNKPTVFVGLDDNVVVVGFQDTASLQVWDLVTGKLVRAFEGKGKECHSMVAISDARIAVGWHNGRQHVLVVFSATTGKQLQTEKGFAYSIQGMAFVEDHLLTLTLDKGLQVWDQDSTGQVCSRCCVLPWKTEWEESGWPASFRVSPVRSCGGPTDSDSHSLLSLRSLLS